MDDHSPWLGGHGRCAASDLKMTNSGGTLQYSRPASEKHLGKPSLTLAEYMTSNTPKHKSQFSVKRLVVYGAVFSIIFTFIFFDRFVTAYSFVTETPVSWMKSSSPLKPRLADVWNQRSDPNLSDSQAFRQLKQLINEEISTQSTREEIREHINQHYRNPSFEPTGFFKTQWEQHAHGYPSFPYHSGNIASVIYHVKDGRFLYAELSTGFFGKRIDLTEPVDLWDFSESSWRQNE